MIQWLRRAESIRIGILRVLTIPMILVVVLLDCTALPLPMFFAIAGIMGSKAISRTCFLAFVLHFLLQVRTGVQDWCIRGNFHIDPDPK